MDIGRAVAKGELAETLSNAAGGVVAPALLIEYVTGYEVADAVGVSAELTFDRPSPERAAVRLRSEAGEVKAVLGFNGERAAQCVQSEEGIGAGDQCDVGDGRFRQQVPVHAVPEWLVDAHAVLEYRNAGRRAE